MSHPCRMCDSVNTQILHRRKFAHIKNATFLQGYDVCVCHECGFGFAADIPSQHAFDEYYRSLSKYDGAIDYAEENRKNYTPYLMALRKYVSDDQAQIMDIGCATGGFLQALRKNGYGQLIGVDPSKACADLVGRLTGVTGVHAALSHLPKIYAPKAVFLLSVLEHVRDLRGAMGSLSSLLPMGSFLFLETPNVEDFGACAQPPFQEFSMEHINYFEAGSLAHLVEPYGFTLLESIRHVPGNMLCIFQRVNSPPPRRSPNRASLDCLTAYIQDSKRLEADLLQRIRPYYGKRIILWGMGTLTRYLLAEGFLDDCDIQVFVDQNPHYAGGAYALRGRSIPVVPPKDMLRLDGTIPVLIASQFYQQHILQELISRWKRPGICLF